MASANLKNPPIFKEEECEYEDWKKDLELWTLLTDLPKNKVAIAVHLSLSGRARQATSELSVDDLKSEDGISRLIAKLDRVYLQDENWRCFNNYLAFENCKRSEDQSIDDFLSEFDRRHFKLKECGVVIHDAVLACRLLKSCNLNDVLFQLALSTTKEMTFENMRATLKRLFADKGVVDVPVSKAKGDYLITSPPAHSVMIKEEPSDAFYSTGYSRRRQGNRRSSGYRRSGLMQGRMRRAGHTNPVGADGRTTSCFNCGSKAHWIRDCPNSNPMYVGSGNVDEGGFTGDEVVHITLMTEKLESDDKINKLLGETIGCMILDLGCSKTVCGKKWLELYLDTLDEKQLNKVRYESSNAVFRFGDGAKHQSLKQVQIPCIMAGKDVHIHADVVDCNIPLLFSKKAMKFLGMVIDTNEDKVNVFNQNIPLGITSMGHYTMALVPDHSDFKLERVFLSINDDTDIVAKKLHRQFAHPSSEKLKKLVKNAGHGSEKLFKSIDAVTDRCETCIKFKRPRPRPVVTFPLASSFNEVVAMDLKSWQGYQLLVMVDLATRFCSAAVLTNKKPESVVNALFSKWILTFGAPRKFLSDNGGEFNNELMRCLGGHFGIDLMCTAAESPWSNGICERLNCIIGISIQKIINDTKCSLVVALSWAVSARNALQNVHGYSPNQLVFGYNPSLPNVIGNEPPALEERVTSQIVLDNLNAMHAARKDFICNESSERIRRALLRQVREDDISDMCVGDSVYYKRLGEDMWRGPGKVIGHEGKEVLVKHGGYYVKVHTCRLQKKCN